MFFQYKVRSWHIRFAQESLIEIRRTLIDRMVISREKNVSAQQHFP
ncbi:protein of unknown function [Trichlorobacter ammonificans]|uniref:Uncharacterized protein n=1 Tax=Trichlorobacter ammonificans TaxID=2916410 RepID=A0ABN8HFG1_9BACT|nr:protein of unknown function [Trichlorobacter ammonificans]